MLQDDHNLTASSPNSPSSSLGLSIPETPEKPPKPPVVPNVDAYPNTGAAGLASPSGAAAYGTKISILYKANSKARSFAPLSNQLACVPTSLSTYLCALKIDLTHKKRYNKYQLNNYYTKWFI